MKKIYLAILLFVMAFNCFSQEVQWELIHDTEAYDGNFNYVKIINKGMFLDANSSFIYQKYDRNIKYDYLVDIFEKEDYLINAESVIPNGTKDIFAENILTPYQNKEGKNWFNIHYVEVLKSKNRDTAFQYSNKALTRYLKLKAGSDPEWWQTVSMESKIFQVIVQLKNIFNGADFYILNIEKNGSMYALQVQCDSWLMYDTIVPESLQPKEGDIVSLTMYPDGEYLDIFFEDTYLIGSYVAMDNEFKKQFESLLETNTCDLSNVTFPRRADKNHSVGTSCIVAERLRLRKEENTTSTTLQTMQTGTQVKILQLGKKQTIDGITANWVQVELADGMKGWCFGGYLVERCMN